MSGQDGSQQKLTSNQNMCMQFLTENQDHCILLGQNNEAFVHMNCVQESANISEEMFEGCKSLLQTNKDGSHDRYRLKGNALESCPANYEQCCAERGNPRFYDAKDDFDNGGVPICPSERPVDANGLLRGPSQNMDREGEASLSFEAVGAAAGSSMAEFVPRGVMYFYDGESKSNVARGEGCFYSAGSGGAVQSQCDMNSYGEPGAIPSQCAVEYAACGDGSADFALMNLGEDVPRSQLSVQINPNEKRVRERFHVDSEERNSLHKKYLRGAINRYAHAVGRVHMGLGRERGLGGDMASGGMRTVMTPEGEPVYLMAGQYLQLKEELNGAPCDKRSCQNVSEALRQLSDKQKLRLKSYLNDSTKKGRAEARGKLGPNDRNLGALMNIFEYEGLSLKERYGNDDNELLRRAQNGDFNSIQDAVSNGISRCNAIGDEKNDESRDEEYRQNAVRREQICREELQKAQEDLKELPNIVKTAIKTQYEKAQNAPEYDGFEPLPRAAREIYQQPDATSVLSGQLAYSDLGVGIEAMMAEQEGFYM